MEEPATREQLVKRIQAERAVLGSSFAGLTAAQLDVPGVAGHWSVKDVLVHVAWWEQETAAKLQGAVTAHDQLGGEDNEAQIDRVNDSVYRDHRTTPATQVAATFDAALMRLLQALSGLDDDAVLANLEFVAENTYRHYPEHAAQIGAWRAREANA